MKPRASSPPARSRKTLRRRVVRAQRDDITAAIATHLGIGDRVQLALALPDAPPRRRGFIRVETCVECHRRGYHLCRCSRRP